MATGQFGLAPPPISASSADVFNLATVILQDYFVGSELYESITSLGEADALAVEIRINTSDLRNGIAALSALQLVFGAAVATTDYVDDTDYRGGDIDADRLIDLSAHPDFQLEIDFLTTGSILAKLKFNRKNARSRILTITCILALIVPHVFGPISLVVAIVQQGDQEIGDEERDRRLRDLEEENRGLRTQLEEQGQRYDLLENRVKALELPSVDKGALAAADVAVVSLEIKRAS